MKAPATRLRLKEYYLHNSSRRDIIHLLLMTVPFFLIAVVFNYIPLWGWIMAFIDYTPGVSVFASKFVGLKYFIRLLDVDSSFLLVMRNTIVLSLLYLLIFPLSATFAIMITEVKNNVFKKVIQIVSSFPNFISWIIVYAIFYAFLSLDDGMLNIILVKIHILKEPINFLAEPKLSWFLMTFASIWKGLGYNAIMFISTIATIDQQMYEAADVDGAGRWGKIWNITVPGIMPTFSILMILTIASLLSSGFDQFYVFYNPLVRDSIEVLDTYTYRIGLVNYDLSFSTAIGIFKTLVSVLLLFIANGFYKKTAGESII